MNLTLKILFAIFILLPVVVFANEPPVADAGENKVVVYPSSTTATLSGNGSDVEGPVTFLWKQINGDSAALIDLPTAAITTVSMLKPGIYTFALSVTDSNSVSQSDTVSVSVLQKLTWVVEGVAREALVHLPSTSIDSLAPIVIAYHGHDETDSGYAARGFELSWPEALVVYPQGLRTKGKIVDLDCRKAGWQIAVGEINCADGIKNQDLKFFDSILITLKEQYNADSNLVFAQGFSNGGAFIYNALWPARRKRLAAMAISGGDLDSIGRKKPIPLIQAAGTRDNQAPISQQQEDVAAVRELNQCDTTGTVWATGPDGLEATHFASPIGYPVVFVQYDGSHSFPPTVPPLVMKFFKEIADSITSAAIPLPLITKISSGISKKISLNPVSMNSSFVNVAVPLKKDE